MMGNETGGLGLGVGVGVWVWVHRRARTGDPVEAAATGASCSPSPWSRAAHQLETPAASLPTLNSSLAPPPPPPKSCIRGMPIATVDPFDMAGLPGARGMCANVPVQVTQLWNLSTGYAGVRK